MTYTIKFESQGPAGMVYYQERDSTLPFYWEGTTVGFDVYLPSSEKWAAFCDEHNAASAKDRREEIVGRLANKVARQEARGAKVSIDDTGITFSYEGSWFRALLRKILGRQV